MKRYQGDKNKISSVMSLEEVADRVRVMRHQEDTSYLYRYYLPSSSSSSMDTTEIREINVVWREKICQWSYNVVDHFDLSREVVSVSLSLFDRYFATLGNIYNGNMALLASLTTLHIAIKLFDTKKIKLSTLANLSRGQFNSNDIEIMEWTILSALQWRLHPPTPYAFVEHILFFLPLEVNHTIRTGLCEVSKYLTELAVCDAYFVDRAHSSTIAFAAILNVMEDMNYSKFSGGLREAFLRNLACLVNLHHRSDDIVNARKRLRKMFSVSSTIYGTTTPINTKNMSDVNCVTPHQTSPTSPGQENYYGSVCGDNISLADRSMSSASALSNSNQNIINTSHISTTTSAYRSTSNNSVDTSKSGSCRFAQKPSPRRTNFFASVSPIITSSRAASTLIEAGIQ